MLADVLVSICVARVAAYSDHILRDSEVGDIVESLGSLGSHGLFSGPLSQEYPVFGLLAFLLEAHASPFLGVLYLVLGHHTIDVDDALLAV